MGNVLKLERQGMYRSAEFSPCKLYRYTLTRIWDDSKPACAFLLLNPSTADEIQDDPTIRRCIGFAKSWGFGALVILNLFAWRSTNPDVLGMIDDPVGVDNMAWILYATKDVPLILCGWGTKAVRNQDKEVLALLRAHGRKLSALQVNQDGTPSHPLYLRSDLVPEIFDA